MPKLANRLPKYRKHPTGQAIVSIDGNVIYLGPYGSRKSKIAYRAKIDELKARRKSGAPRPKTSDLRIVELSLAYLEHAEGYYRESDEASHIAYSLRPIKDLFGTERAVDFGPLKMQAVQLKMIKDGLSRGVINQRCKRIRKMFRWAVSQEMLPASIVQALETVEPLRAGRSDARETDPVKPVPKAFVEAVKNKKKKIVSPQIRAMIELQEFTGARPGEVCRMRTYDIDTSGKVWIYTPSRHKTQHHGHSRKIFLGPKAQAVLKPWLRPELEAYLFQPKEAVAWKRQQLTAARKTPLSCGNRTGTNRQRNPKRQPSELYSVRAYHQAVRQGCLKAKVPTWHPHQLRHNAATFLRKEFGLDIARVVLGHRSPQITEVYAELDHAKAADVMGKVG